MVAQRDGHEEALIPMPELTWPALRKAVATVAPSRLPELFEDMQNAFGKASEQNSVNPIRFFFLHWGMVVEIERHPETAHKFHAAEQSMASHDAEVREGAIREISDIVRAANQAVAGE